MMIDIERMKATLDGAKTIGLPMWIGLTCGSWDRSPGAADGTARLLDGEPLSDAIDALEGYDIDALVIMHTSVDLIDGCLDVAPDRWAGPVGVYAHSGDYVYGDWVFDDVMSHAAHRDATHGWIDRGIRIIGGCCGIGPVHIRALAELRCAAADRRSLRQGFTPGYSASWVSGSGRVLRVSRRAGGGLLVFAVAKSIAVSEPTASLSSLPASSVQSDRYGR